MIRVAIAATDEDQLSGIDRSLKNGYPDQLEIYGAFSLEALEEVLKSEKTDVVLIDEEFGTENLSEFAGYAVAVLTANPNQSEQGQYFSIFKYGRNNTIYEALMMIYEAHRHGAREKTTLSIELMEGDTRIPEQFEELEESKTMTGSARTTKIVCFVPVSGGAGATVSALAFGRYCTNVGKKAFYLNLESLNAIPSFLYSRSNCGFGLSDVIGTLKNKDENVNVQLAACIQFDAESGISFIGESQSVADMEKLDGAMLEQLLSKIIAWNEYDYVIIDINFDMKNLAFECMQKSDTTILVMRNDTYSKHKYDRMENAIEAQEMKTEAVLMPKVCVMINGMYPQEQYCFETDEMELFGIQKPEESQSVKETVEKLAQSSLWKSL